LAGAVSSHSDLYFFSVYRFIVNVSVVF